MDKFLARQPILNAREKIFGYELLFRSGLEPFFSSDDPDHASSSVVVNSFLLFGIQNMTAGTPAFINFTRELLVRRFATLLPKDQIIIEVLEDIQPDEQVIESCRSLSDLGFRLALDDFEDAPDMGPLIELADILKIDFIKTPRSHREAMVKKFSGKRPKLLAEKVETREQFREASEAGFDLFQGYFFARPETMQIKEIPGFKLNYLRLLQAVLPAEPNMAEVEEIIKREPSLCYRLLRYLNSPLFGFRGEIQSIRHGLILLGMDEMKKWASLVALAGLGSDKPEALVVLAIVRAKTCELLAPASGFQGKAMDLFLIGLFSLVDAILQRPLAGIMRQLAVSESVRTTLLQGNTRLKPVLDMAVASEAADWERVRALSAFLGVDEATVNRAYSAAIEWSQTAFRVNAGTPSA